MKTQVKLQKLKELPDAKHPNNIPEGDIRIEVFQGRKFFPPIIGDSFWSGDYWRTSRVTEIIDDKTFRTQNSIYQWEMTEIE
jgi:hypothetical protein